MYDLNRRTNKCDKKREKPEKIVVRIDKIDQHYWEKNKFYFI